MRILGLLTILAVMMLSAGPVAASSWWDYIFPPAYPKFERPYVEDGKTPHNSQWETDEWSPEDWTQSRGSEEAVLAGLENAGIIKDHDWDADEVTPTLEVGQNFLRLSDQEKTHVVKYIDSVHGITKKAGGAIIIERSDGRWLQSDWPVGIYTAKGLQLQ